MTIHIENIGARHYRVTVEGASTTMHYVTVMPEYLQKLTGVRAARILAHEHRHQHACGYQDRRQNVARRRLLAQESKRHHNRQRYA